MANKIQILFIIVINTVFVFKLGMKGFIAGGQELISFRAH